MGGGGRSVGWVSGGGVGPIGREQKGVASGRVNPATTPARQHDQQQHHHGQQPHHDQQHQHDHYGQWQLMTSSNITTIQCCGSGSGIRIRISYSDPVNNRSDPQHCYQLQQSSITISISNITTSNNPTSSRNTMPEAKPQPKILYLILVLILYERCASLHQPNWVGIG